MAKKLNEKQLEELSHITQWSLCIIEFIGVKSLMGSSWTKLFEDAINEAFSKQDLRGMRYVFKDMNEMANGLSLAEIDELNKILSGRFGKNLDDYNKSMVRKINAIAKRGGIANAEECRLVETRIEEIYADETKSGEVEKLNSLLADFEEKVGRNEIPPHLLD